MEQANVFIAYTYHSVIPLLNGFTLQVAGIYNQLGVSINSTWLESISWAFLVSFDAAPEEYSVNRHQILGSAF